VRSANAFIGAHGGRRGRTPPPSFAYAALRPRHRQLSRIAYCCRRSRADEKKRTGRSTFEAETAGVSIKVAIGENWRAPLTATPAARMTASLLLQACVDLFNDAYCLGEGDIETAKAELPVLALHLNDQLVGVDETLEEILILTNVERHLLV
jgi:hypothetical protein